jgi:UDP-N-acetyl-D-mannosaminuronate dehydrogenase
VKQQLGHPFRFVELAQEINASMPSYVARRAQDLLNDNRQAINGATVLMLGVTYKPNIGDDRESPAKPLAKRLKEMGALVSFHDPHIAHWNVEGVERVEGDLLQAVADADLVILVQNHRGYDVPLLAGHARLFLDTRGVTDGAGRL